MLTGESYVRSLRWRTVWSYLCKRVESWFDRLKSILATFSLLLLGVFLFHSRVIVGASSCALYLSGIIDQSSFSDVHVPPRLGRYCMTVFLDWMSKLNCQCVMGALCLVTCQWEGSYTRYDTGGWCGQLCELIEVKACWSNKAVQLANIFPQMRRNIIMRCN